MEDYEAVKKWFITTSGDHRFEASKEKNCIEWLKICCEYTGKTPDELANCASIEREREIVALILRENGLGMLDIAQRLGVLNNFWVHNGRKIFRTYRGWIHTEVS